MMNPRRRLIQFTSMADAMQKLSDPRVLTQIEINQHNQKVEERKAEKRSRKQKTKLKQWVTR